MLTPAIARIALATLCVLASTAAAQPKRGDYVLCLFAQNSNISWIDQNGGRSVWVAPQTRINHNYRALTMDVDNRSIVAALWDGSSFDVLHRISRGRVVTTIVGLPNQGFERPTDVRVDEDGSYLVSSTSLFGGTRQDLLRVRNGGLTTLLGNRGGIAAMALHPDTGDALVAVTGPNAILAIDRAGAVSTLVGLGTFAPIDISVDAARGRIALLDGFGAGIVVLDLFGNVVGRMRSAVASMTFNERGNVVVSDTFHLAEVTIQGVPVRTLGNMIVGMGLSVLEYGTREVAGLGTPRPGGRYTLSFSFVGAGPGKAYLAALSLGGRRPGLRLADGRLIGIVPDALFLQTARFGDIPGVTRGLRGTTGVNGNGFAQLSIPASAPVGLRVYATAVVLDPAAPLGLRTANTWAFTVTR